jgi:hypothetical protein
MSYRRKRRQACFRPSGHYSGGSLQHPRRRTLRAYTEFEYAVLRLVFGNSVQLVVVVRIPVCGLDLEDVGLDAVVDEAGELLVVVHIDIHVWIGGTPMGEIDDQRLATGRI